jgi:proteasome alpha subunit
MLTPYDFQENLQQRAQYIRNRLRAGSPVIGISYDNGIMLLALKRRGRKVYEIYDRLMFSAIGNQADVENLRLAAIDFAHQEGFVRSPDDVTIQRVVGFALSPALKKAFGDPLTTPLVARALFAELHDAPERDQFYTLNYDGEFLPYERFAAIGGTQTAEEQATRYSGGAPDAPADAGERAADCADRMGRRLRSRAAGRCRLHLGGGRTQSPARNARRGAGGSRHLGAPDPAREPLPPAPAGTDRAVSEAAIGCG